MRWCKTCQKMRAVVDESMESAFQSPNREVTYWVVALACGHHIQYVREDRQANI